jgi:hypothetical protein
MIEIIVDCNSDKVYIVGKGFDGYECSTKDPVRTIYILEKLLEVLSNKMSTSLNIRLIKIDEDSQVTVREW